MSVIALAAGGTAGHIEPAIACAKAIKEIDNNANVFIVGTSKGLERDIVPKRGIELALIPATPLPRNISFATLSLSKEIPINVVSKMMGHTSIRYTEHYAKTLDNDVSKQIVKMSNLFSDKFGLN